MSHRPFTQDRAHREMSTWSSLRRSSSVRITTKRISSFQSKIIRSENQWQEKASIQSTLWSRRRCLKTWKEMGVSRIQAHHFRVNRHLLIQIWQASVCQKSPVRFQVQNYRVVWRWCQRYCKPLQSSKILVEKNRLQPHLSRIAITRNSLQHRFKR